MIDLAEAPYRIHQFESLLHMLESVLSVEQLAETRLRCVEPSEDVAAAAEWMAHMGFDAAPVSAPKPFRYVALSDIEGATGTIDDLAKLIDMKIVVASDTSLARGIALLAERPFYFVAKADKLHGIVTRADLQRPAVSVVGLGLILAAESGLNLILPDRLPDWKEKVDKAKMKQAAKEFARLRSNKVEIGEIECLYLPERLALVKHVEGLVDELRFESIEEFDEWAEILIRLRNRLAHAGGLLRYQPDPMVAVQLFNRVRWFAESVWAIVA